MKIFCIGRNYVAHAQELNNDVPTNPLVFMKPSTALLQDNKAFYYPSFSSDIHYEVELVLKIKKHGKHIEKQFAHLYYDQIGLGIDFTARDIQSELKKKGHPWEIAKSFDNSAVISPFYTLSDFPSEIPFSLKKNGEIVQDGNSNRMIFDFDTIISYISKRFTLQIGDLIYTGTPAGVGPIQIGDKLEGFIAETSAFQVEIK